MNRFQKKQKQHSGNSWIYLALAVGIIGCTWNGIQKISAGTDQQQKESLEAAVRRDMVICYALEGSYPQSLAYLEEHYGLTYDTDKYIVNYEVMGSNLMPDVTVLEKRKKS